MNVAAIEVVYFVVLPIMVSERLLQTQKAMKHIVWNGLDCIALKWQMKDDIHNSSVWWQFSFDGLWNNMHNRAFALPIFPLLFQSTIKIQWRIFANISLDAFSLSMFVHAFGLCGYFCTGFRWFAMLLYVFRSSLILCFVSVFYAKRRWPCSFGISICLHINCSNEWSDLYPVAHAIMSLSLDWTFQPKTNKQTNEHK